MINILWDSSHLWGYLLLHAMRTVNIPYQVLKGEKIAQAGVSGKLLLVPGGSARGKAAALGPQGQEAIRTFVAQGGSYVGFCGGAGLALQEGLGLCPWGRANLSDRIQHLVSGHVLCSLAIGNPLVPPHQPEALLPVWWPARFQEPEDNTDEVQVLARYMAPGPDLYVADLPFVSIPPEVRTEWDIVYGVNIRPSFLDQQPCVISGTYGQGQWLLSYSHLETPAAFSLYGSKSDAETWLFHILREWTQLEPSQSLGEWNPATMPVRWEDPILLSARDAVERLLAQAEALGLLFPRRPWLRGWRAGVPGSQFNALYAALCTTLSLSPLPGRLRLWRKKEHIFQEQIRLFEQGAQSWLLARRLADTLSDSLPGALPKALLVDQRDMLFGTPMTHGGLCGQMQQVLEDLLTED